tara:strand:- start:51 stop:383 length:333 start_codon:yes stop_codon:yes gene_type:complete
MKKLDIKITDKAIIKAKELIENSDKTIGLRIAVLKGGCSGMTYNVEYAKEINEQDEVITAEGINFVIDPSAILFLIGSTIDWKQEKFKSGFTFENPNEKARCGCGESFSI